MRITIVAGGPSSEAEVSRASAQGVAEALLAAGHQVETLELDHGLPARLMAGKPEVVFPVAHGPLGEDGCLQGMLEVLGLPYVGSGVLASALGANKKASKSVFVAAGLPVTSSVSVGVVPAGEALERELERLRQMLGAVIVVKPASGGSAIGVSIIDEQAGPPALERALQTALALDSEALVESFWPGDEVTCGVLETERGVPEALPPTLIQARAADWYDFQSKYGAGGSDHVCPAPFESSLRERIQQAAVLAHRSLGGRDLSRTDFIVKASGEYVVLELNSLPGMTKTSLFPEAAAVAGIEFPELCDRLVRRAAARPGRKPLSGVPLPE